MIWFDRNIIIIIEKKQSYFDCGYHLMFSYTWERVWSVCVWVWVCVLRYLLACIYAWVNVYPTFYGDKLVKKLDRRSGTTRPPRPTLTHRFTHSDHLPGGPSRADAALRDDRSKKAVSSRITVRITSLVTAGLDCNRAFSSTCVWAKT